MLSGVGMQLCFVKVLQVTASSTGNWQTGAPPCACIMSSYLTHLESVHLPPRNSKNHDDGDNLICPSDSRQLVVHLHAAPVRFCQGCNKSVADAQAASLDIVSTVCTATAQPEHVPPQSPLDSRYQGMCGLVWTPPSRIAATTLVRCPCPLLIAGSPRGGLKSQGPTSVDQLHCGYAGDALAQLLRHRHPYCHDLHRTPAQGSRTLIRRRHPSWQLHDLSTLARACEQPDSV